MAKPRTYRNMAAKWWAEAKDYPPEWKEPVDGQLELLDERGLPDVASDSGDAEDAGSGSAAIEKWLDETSVL